MNSTIGGGLQGQLTSCPKNSGTNLGNSQHAYDLGRWQLVCEE